MEFSYCYTIFEDSFVKSFIAGMRAYVKLMEVSGQLCLLTCTPNTALANLAVSGLEAGQSVLCKRSLEDLQRSMKRSKLNKAAASISTS